MIYAIALILAAVSATAGRVLGLILISIVTGWFLSYYAIKSRIFESIYVISMEIFESVPVISFFPIVLLLFVSGIGGSLGVELAVDFLVFTAVVWNIWMGEYQAFKTVPKEMVEVGENYKLTLMEKLQKVYIPFSIPRIAANLFPSVSDGFFYIAVSEVFSVGNKSFQVFGVGSVLYGYISSGNVEMIEVSLIILGLVIVLIIALLREFAKYAVSRYALDTDTPVFRRGRFNIREAARRSGIIALNPLTRLANYNRIRRSRAYTDEYYEPEARKRKRRLIPPAIGIAMLLILAYLAYLIVSSVSLSTWYYLFSVTPDLLMDLLYDYIRVAIIVLVSMFFAIFVGYYFAVNRKAEAVGIPAIQAFSAYPAPIYFPFIFLGLSLSVSSIFGYLTDEAFVLFLGFISTFYYVFYSFWMGVKAMPQEYSELMKNLDLTFTQRMRRVILPATFPYLISGISSTINSAWGGLMIGEYWPDIIGNKTLSVGHGLMKVIDVATNSGNITLAAWASFLFLFMVFPFFFFFTKKMMDLARRKYVAEEGIFSA